MDGLITYIKQFDFEQTVFSHPVSNQADVFSKILLNALDKFVPKKTICFRPNDPPWLNTYTRLILRKKTEITSYLKQHQQI